MVNGNRTEGEKTKENSYDEKTKINFCTPLIRQNDTIDELTTFDEFLEMGEKGEQGSRSELKFSPENFYRLRFSFVVRFTFAGVILDRYGTIKRSN